MRSFSVAVWLVAVVVVSASLALLAASAPASCNDPDSARTAGLYVQSADGYISVLSKDPGSTCAASGMEKLCTEASQLVGKQPREANAIYTAMFSHEPEATRLDHKRGHKRYAVCAETGLQKTATTTADALSTTTTDAPTTTSASTPSTTTTSATATSATTTITAHDGGPAPTNVTITVNNTVAAGRGGPKGNPGTPGRNGANGRNGRNGRDGRDGRNGTTEVIVCPTTTNCGAG